MLKVFVVESHGGLVVKALMLCHYGSGMIPGLGTCACHGHSQKEKKKKKFIIVNVVIIIMKSYPILDAN